MAPTRLAAVSAFLLPLLAQGFGLGERCLPRGDMGF
jgi:hypothetical protein